MPTISGNNAQVDYSVFFDGETVTVTGTGAVFRNCVFTGDFDAQESLTITNSIFLGAITVTTGKVLTLYNCVSPDAEPTVDGTITDTDCMWSTNPLFVDVDAEDYRLTNDSPARAAGIDLDLAVDYIGNAVPDGAPDIGAFQTILYFLYGRMSIMAIAQLPTAPTPSDTTAVFNSKAFALIAAFAQFITETNAAASAIDNNTDLVIAAKDDAQTAATNSAAAYASTLALAGADPYVGGTTYAPGEAVIGTNGITYVRINTSAAGDDPVTSITGNWQQVNIRPPSYQNHTTSPTLSLSDLDGSVVHTNIGASAEVVFDLPPGVEFPIFTIAFFY